LHRSMADAKGEPMYAVLVAVAIDPNHQDEAQEHLHKEVVPQVKQAPGAVAGYWLAPSGGQGYATIVFESEDQAKAAAEMVPQRVPEFVTVNHVQVQEIVAHF
jgi:hypothetical protein